MECNCIGCCFVILVRIRFRMIRYFYVIGFSCKKLMLKNFLSFGLFELELGNEKGYFKEKVLVDCFFEVLFVEYWNCLRKIVIFKCFVVIDYR